MEGRLKMKNLMKALKGSSLPPGKLRPLMRKMRMQKRMKDDLPWVDICKTLFSFVVNTGDRNVLHNMCEVILLNLPINFEEHANESQHLEHTKKSINSLLTHIACNLNEKEVELRAELNPVMIKLFAAFIDLEIQLARPSEEDGLISRIFAKEEILFGYDTESYLDALLNCKSLLYKSLRKPPVGVPLIKNILVRLKGRPLTPPVFLKSLLLGKIWLFMSSKKELHSVRDEVECWLKMPPIFVDWAFMKKIDWLNLFEWNTKTVMRNMSVARCLRTLYGVQAVKHSETVKNVKEGKELHLLPEGSHIEKLHKRKGKEKQHENIESIATEETYELQEICDSKGEERLLPSSESISGVKKEELPSDKEMSENDGVVGELLVIGQKSQSEASKNYEVLEKAQNSKKPKQKNSEMVQDLPIETKSDSACTQDMGQNNGRQVTKKKQRKRQEGGSTDGNRERIENTSLPTTIVVTSEVSENKISEVTRKRKFNETLEKVTLTHSSQVTGKEEAENPEPRELEEASLVLTEESVHDMSHKEEGGKAGIKIGTQKTEVYPEEEIDTKVYPQEGDEEHEVIIIKKRKIGDSDKPEVISETRMKFSKLVDLHGLENLLISPTSEPRQKPSKEKMIASRKKKRKSSLTFTVTDIDNEKISKVLRDEDAKEISYDSRCQHDVCLNCSSLGKIEQNAHSTPRVSVKEPEIPVRGSSLVNAHASRERAESSHAERKQKSVCTSTEDIEKQVSESPRESFRSSFISKSFEDLAADVSKGFDISKLLPGNIEISRSFSRIKNDTSTVDKTSTVPKNKVPEKSWCNVDPASVLAKRNVTISSVTVSRKELPRKEVGLQDIRDNKGDYQMSKHNLYNRYDSSGDDVNDDDDDEDDDEDSSDSSCQTHPQSFGYLWQNKPGHSLLCGKSSVEINPIHWDNQDKTGKDKNMNKESSTDSSLNTHNLQPRILVDEEPKFHEDSTNEAAVPSLPTEDSESDIEVTDVIYHSTPADSHSSDDIDEAMGTDADIVPCDEDHEMFTDHEVKLYHEKLHQDKIKEEEEEINRIVENRNMERKTNLTQRRYSSSDGKGTHVDKIYKPAEKKKATTDPVSRMMNQLYKNTSNTKMVTKNAEVNQSKCKSQEPPVVLNKEIKLSTQEITSECQEDNLDSIFKSIAEDTGKCVDKLPGESRIKDKLSENKEPEIGRSSEMDGQCSLLDKTGVSSSSIVDKEFEGKGILDNDLSRERRSTQTEVDKGNSIDCIVSLKGCSSDINFTPEDKGSNEYVEEDGTKVNTTSIPLEEKVTKEDFTASTSGLEQKNEDRNHSQVFVKTDANENQEKNHEVNEFSSKEECINNQKEKKELIDEECYELHTVISNDQENIKSVSACKESPKGPATGCGIGEDKISEHVDETASAEDIKENSQSNDFDVSKKVNDAKSEKDIEVVDLAVDHVEHNNHNLDESSKASEEQRTLSSIPHKKRKSHVLSPVSPVYSKSDCFTLELKSSTPQKYTKIQNISLNEKVEVNRAKDAQASTSPSSGTESCSQKQSSTTSSPIMLRSSLTKSHSPQKFENVSDSCEEGLAKTRLPSNSSTIDSAVAHIEDEADVDCSLLNDSVNLSISDSEVQMQTKTSRILRRKTRRSVSCIDILSNFVETAMETDSCTENASIDKISESILLNAQADISDAAGEKLLPAVSKDGALLEEQVMEAKSKSCTESANYKSLRSQRSVQSSPLSIGNAVLPTSTPKRKELTKKCIFSQNQAGNSVKNDKVLADSFIVCSHAVEGDKELEVLSAPGDEDDQHIGLDKDHVEEITEIHVTGKIVPVDDVSHHTCKNCKEELTDKVSSVEESAAVKARLQPVEGWQCTISNQTSVPCVQDGHSPNGIPQLMPYRVPKEKLHAEVLISPEVSDEECEMVSPGHGNTEQNSQPKETKLAIVQSKTSPEKPFITYRDSPRRPRSSRIRSPQKPIPEEQDESTPVRRSSTKKMKSSELSGGCGTESTLGKGRRRLAGTASNSEKCERISTVTLKSRNSDKSEKTTPKSIRLRNSEGGDQVVVRPSKSPRLNVDSEKTALKQLKKDSGLSQVDEIDATAASANLQEDDVISGATETTLRSTEITPKRISPRLKSLDGNEKTPESIKSRNSEGSDQAVTRQSKSQRLNVESDRTPTKQQKKHSGLSQVGEIDATAASTNFEEDDVISGATKTTLRITEMTPKRVSPRLKYLDSHKDVCKSEGEKTSLKSPLSLKGKQRNLATSKQQGSTDSNKSSTIEVQALKRNTEQEKGGDYSSQKLESESNSVREDSKLSLRSSRKTHAIKRESQTPDKSQEVIDINSSSDTKCDTPSKKRAATRTLITSISEEATKAEESVQFQADHREKRDEMSEKKKDHTKLSPRRLTTRQATSLIASSPAKELPSLKELQDGGSVHISNDSRVNICDRNIDMERSPQCQDNDTNENRITDEKTDIVLEENEGKSGASEVSKIREVKRNDSDICSSPLKTGSEICSPSLEKDSEVCHTPLSKAIAKLRTKNDSEKYARDCRGSSDRSPSHALEGTTLISDDKRPYDGEDLDKETRLSKKRKSDQAVFQGESSFEHAKLNSKSCSNQAVSIMDINTDEATSPKKCNSELDPPKKNITEQAVSKSSKLAQVESSNLFTLTLRNRKRHSHMLNTEQADVSKSPDVMQIEELPHHSEELSGCTTAKQVTENGIAASSSAESYSDESSEKESTIDEDNESSNDNSTKKIKSGKGERRTRSLRYRKITYNL